MAKNIIEYNKILRISQHASYWICCIFAVKCCDEGKSFLAEIPDSPDDQAFRNIIKSLYIFIDIVQLHVLYVRSLMINHDNCIIQ